MAILNVRYNNRIHVTSHTYDMSEHAFVQKPIFHVSTRMRPKFACNNVAYVDFWKENNVQMVLYKLMRYARIHPATQLHFVNPHNLP